jgi:peptide/nickel transport system substrate-binding protein
MRGSRQWRGVTACMAAVAVAVGASACGGARSGGPATPAGVATGGKPAQAHQLTFVVPQEWPRLDPTQVAAAPEGTMLLALEPLVRITPQGGFVPDLAAKFSSPDPKTYVYEIRRGVKFWDGQPMTIQDVLYSLKMHVGPKSGSVLARGFFKVKSVTQTGPDQVMIKLSKPDSTFNTWVAQAPVVEQRVREAHLKSIGSPDALNVGTGPYKWASVQAGEQVTLQRNDTYWGPRPGIERLVLKYIPDDSSRLLAMRSGDIDGSLAVPNSEIKQYQAIQGFKLIKGPDPAVELLSMDTNKAPWNDVHVRRAVAMAIDKQGLVNAILRGQGRPAETLPDPASLGRLLPSDQVGPLLAKLSVKHDLAAAKAELAKSSRPTGFRDSILTSGGEVDSTRAAQAIADQLRPLGINLAVKVQPDAAFNDAVFFKHNYGAAVTSFTTDSKDPAAIATYLAYSGSGYTDIAGYKDPVTDAALEESTRLPLTDKAGRAAALSRGLERIAAQMPYVPLYHGEMLAEVRDGLNFPTFDGQWWLIDWPGQLLAA